MINGDPIDENTEYSICTQEYHYKNSVESFNITSEELGTPKILTTSAQDVLEEYLTSHQHIDSHIEGRITFK